MICNRCNTETTDTFLVTSDLMSMHVCMPCAFIALSAKIRYEKNSVVVGRILAVTQKIAEKSARITHRQ